MDNNYRCKRVNVVQVCTIVCACVCVCGTRKVGGTVGLFSEQVDTWKTRSRGSIYILPEVL